MSTNNTEGAQTPRSDGHKLIDRLLIFSLAKSPEAGRILADRIDEMESALTTARQEVEKLRAWKAEALAVEKEWDAQTVGMLLGMPLGARIRAGIEPAIRTLLAQLAAARSAHPSKEDEEKP